MKPILVDELAKRDMTGPTGFWLGLAGGAAFALFMILVDIALRVWG